MKKFQEKKSRGSSKSREFIKVHESPGSPQIPGNSQTSRKNHTSPGDKQRFRKEHVIFITNSHEKVTDGERGLPLTRRQEYASSRKSSFKLCRKTKRTATLSHQNVDPLPPPHTEIELYGQVPC